MLTIRVFFLASGVASLLAVGTAAWLLVSAPPSKPRPAAIARPRGFVFTFADRMSACSVYAVNNRPQPLDSVVLTFSGKGLSPMVLTYDRPNGVTFQFDADGGAVRTTARVAPGQRSMFVALAGAGILKTVTVRSEGRETTHAVEAALTTGRQMLIAFESEDQVKVSTE